MARPKKENTEEASQSVDQIDQILSDKQFKGLHYGSAAGTEIKARDIISTGSFFFDQALGGGFRGASWSRFYAEPESGKSAQGLRWGKNWQDHYGEQGFVVVFNAEGRITKELLDRSGISTHPSKFRMINTNNADFIYTITEKLIQENVNDYKYFFMVDSTDACQRSHDSEKTIGEAEKIGGGATIISAAGKRLSLLFTIHEHHLYMTSQVRDKLNTHGPAAGGKDASGGNAPKFYSSLTGQIQKHWSDLSIRETGDPKSKEIGRFVSIKLMKTYNESTGQIVQFPVKYGHIGGIWSEYEAKMLAETWGFLTKKGAWFEFSEEFIEKLKASNITVEKVKFQGDPAVREVFESNPDLVKYIFDSSKDRFKIE